LFYLPFTLCFIIANVTKVSPYLWDNIKVLFYWYVASTPLVALLLVRLWRMGRKAWREINVPVGLSLRVAAVLLFMTLTLAGAEGGLRLYVVDNVVGGPLVRAAGPVNENYFARFEQVGNAGGYSLYEVTRPETAAARQTGDGCATGERA